MSTVCIVFVTTYAFLHIFLVLRDHSTLEASFYSLDEENKWLLPTKKVVEDTLCKFSKSCLVDHLSCSMILDLDDKTYLKNNIFTAVEIGVMKRAAPIGFMKPLPPNLANYLNEFNCDNAKELRAKLLKVQN